MIIARAMRVCLLFTNKQVEVINYVELATTDNKLRSFQIILKIKQ